jgi:hypothetical protein
MLLNYPELIDYSKGMKTTKNYSVSNPMLYSSAVSKLICEKTHHYICEKLHMHHYICAVSKLICEKLHMHLLSG